MADPRLIDVTLDEQTILARSPEVEQDRRVAIHDLLTTSNFRPCRDDAGGPYRLHLAVRDGRLALDIAREDGTPLETHLLALSRFKRPIREYFAVCDSLRAAAPHQAEPIDMARRALHNDAAELLVAALDGKVAIDFATARRLFTLICMLHARS